METLMENVKQQIERIKIDPVYRKGIISEQTAIDVRNLKRARAVAAMETLVRVPYLVARTLQDDKFRTSIPIWSLGSKRSEAEFDEEDRSVWDALKSVGLDIFIDFDGSGNRQENNVIQLRL